MTAEISPPAAEPLASHMAHSHEDHHEIIRLLAGLEAQLAAARSEVRELTAKVAQLESEFGPLARKFAGTATRLAATKAASFVRRNSDRPADRP